MDTQFTRFESVDLAKHDLERAALPEAAVYAGRQYLAPCPHHSDSDASRILLMENSGFTGTGGMYSSAMRLPILFLAASLATQAETIYVDGNAGPGGDGSAGQPYNTLNTAVAYANGVDKPTVIQVAPGRYEVGEPLKIERSMTIKGSNQLEFDADGLPTGRLLDPAMETRIVSGPTFTVGSPMIFVGKSGQLVYDVTLRNLTLQSGPTAIPGLVHFARVQYFEVRDCIFLGRGDSGLSNVPAIDTYASSGTIRRTYTTRLQGAAFMGAGYAQSPAYVIFRKNRSVENVAGAYLVGTSDGITEPGDQLYAEVRDNDLSRNVAGNSTGLRISIKSVETLVGGKTDLATGNIHALIRHNRFIGNGVGIAIDAGAVTRRAPPPPPDVCDGRTFSGSLDLTLRDNEIADSVVVPSLITFTQGQQARNILAGRATNFLNIGYLHSSTFNIDDPDGTLANSFILHPKTDTFTGPPCAADLDNEPLHNTLRINGSIIPDTTP